nr:DMT family transporter [Micromonospora purpureochromogenes]
MGTGGAAMIWRRGAVVSGPTGIPSGRPRPVRMLLVAVAWGSCFVFISWGLRDAPVLWFATVRVLLAGLALLAVAALRGPWLSGRAVPRDLGTWTLIGLLALANVTVAFAAMFAAASGVSAGVASVLANAQPLLVVLPAWWLFGERPRPVEVGAVAVGFGGLVLVAAPSGGGRGAGLALLAAAATTAGTLLARRLAGVDLFALGAWQFLLGGAGLAVAASVLEGPPTAIAWTGRFLAGVAAFAVAATALPYVLWFAELRRAPLTSVTAWTLLVPVVGVVLGVLVLREPVTLVEGAGDVIVVAALVLVARSARDQRDDGEPPSRADGETAGALARAGRPAGTDRAPLPTPAGSGDR